MTSSPHFILCILLFSLFFYVHLKKGKESISIKGNFSQLKDNFSFSHQNYNTKSLTIGFYSCNNVLEKTTGASKIYLPSMF